MILIIDAGSQYTPLVSSILEYTFNIPYQVISHDLISTEHIKKNFIYKGELKNGEFKGNKKMLNGVIFSGGPNSVDDVENSKNSKCFWIDYLIKNKIPILGICYGLQKIVHHFGGNIENLGQGEFGRAVLNKMSSNSVLLKNITQNSVVWMSHNDTATKLPEDFTAVASTDFCENAVIECPAKNIFLVQFHPETKNTVEGVEILKNFLDYAGVYEGALGVNYEKIIAKLCDKIRDETNGQTVLLGLSGGVDSTVLCYLLKKAIPGHFYCIYVDHGFMRFNETTLIESRFKKSGVNLFVCREEERFYKALKGVTEPEEKRKIIGKLFIDVFKEKIAFLPKKPVFLAQGTILSDVIESKGGRANSSLIKSHHNVGGLPGVLGLKLLEPFRNMFKDQVKKLGEFLGVDSKFINRTPFPGPGIAVRIPGEIRRDLVEIAQKADAIFEGCLVKLGLYSKISQAYAAVLPVKSVGVVGDKRRYGYCVSLRAVTTIDYMTASPFEFPTGVLSNIATEIVSKIEAVSRVFYDITSKPPATIELE